MTPEEVARRILWRLDVVSHVAARLADVADIVRAAQAEAVREYAAKVQGLVGAVKELLGDVEGNQRDTGKTG